jgi:hypothetical protein
MVDFFLNFVLWLVWPHGLVPGFNTGGVAAGENLRAAFSKPLSVLGFCLIFAAMLLCIIL